MSQLNELETLEVKSCSLLNLEGLSAITALKKLKNLYLNSHLLTEAYMTYLFNAVGDIPNVIQKLAFGARQNPGDR